MAARAIQSLSGRFKLSLAIRHTFNHQKVLIRFIDEGRLQRDANTVERRKAFHRTRTQSASLSEPVPGALNLAGSVLRHVYLGNHTETHVRTEAGITCIVQTGNDGSVRLPTEGEAVRLTAATADCRVFSVTD